MTITIANGKAYVHTPYNGEFVKAIKGIKARWDAAEKAWVVNENMADAAREIMRTVYGRDDQMNDVATSDIRLRFTDYYSVLQDGITLYGKCIAKAWGRDSGVKVGDDVAFVAGEAYSGGSAKNWRTYIEKGSEIIIKNIPVTLIASQQLPEGIEVVTDEDSKRDALLKRKAELEAALAEINNQLASI